MGHGSRIDAGRIFIHSAHANRRSAGKGKTKRPSAVARGGSRSIDLSGIETVGRFKGSEGSTRISRILILHAGLVHHNRVTGRIKRLTV